MIDIHYTWIIKSNSCKYIVSRTKYISNTKAWKSCKRCGKRSTGPLRPSYLGRGPGHARPLEPWVHFLSKVYDAFNIDQKVLFSKYCDDISNLKFLACPFYIRKKLKICSFLLHHFMAISCSHYVTIFILIFYSHKKFYILIEKFILNIYSIFLFMYFNILIFY